MFYLFLTSDGGTNVAEDFEVNELINVVATCEALDLPLFVLPYAALDIVCDTHVEGSRMIGYDVDIVGFASWHETIIPRG